MTPSAPVCPASVQSSQSMVRNIGKASTWRSVAIQRPGFGMTLATAGVKLSRHEGRGEAEADGEEHGHRRRRRSAEAPSRLRRP